MNNVANVPRQTLSFGNQKGTTMRRYGSMLAGLVLGQCTRQPSSMADRTGIGLKRSTSLTRLAMAVAALSTSAVLAEPAPVRFEAAFITNFGGSSADGIRDVECDLSGNIYVAGTTRSADFPTTRGAFQEKLETSSGKNQWGHNSDIFVAKFNPDGRLVWSTLIGGPGSEEGYGIEIDSQGFVLVHGRGAVGSPITKGVYQEQFKGCGGDDPGNPHNTAQNAYIGKLSPDGARLVWASFFGIDHLHRDLALDGNDDIYVTWGVRPSKNDPKHWKEWMQPSWVAGAFQKEPQGGDDAGVAKIAGDGSRVIWATYLGGADYDSIEGSVRVDRQGFVYVGISTRSKDLPTTPGAACRELRGEVDYYVAKLDPNGSRLVYGTYIGDEGPNWMSTHNLVVDKTGCCYVSTNATSSTFPTTAAAGRTRFSGGHNDWGIVKLSPTGELMAGILLGGAKGDENPDGMRIDADGNLVVFGQSPSDDFPVTRGAYQARAGGDHDAQAVILSPDLSHLIYSTYLGGLGEDAGRAGCLTPTGGLVIVGATRNGKLPTVSAYQPFPSGDWDGFVAVLRRDK